MSTGGQPVKAGCCCATSARKPSARCRSTTGAPTPRDESLHRSPCRTGTGPARRPRTRRRANGRCASFPWSRRCGEQQRHQGEALHGGDERLDDRALREPGHAVRIAPDHQRDRGHGGEAADEAACEAYGRLGRGPLLGGKQRSGPQQGRESVEHQECPEHRAKDARIDEIEGERRKHDAGAAAPM